MPHRITARAPRDAVLPRIEHDPSIVGSFISDAAHVPGGFADGVAFPQSEGEVAALLAAATCVLPVGAQSSLTGGATPRGGLVLSTRALDRIDTLTGDRVCVDAGVPLATLQRSLRASDRYYPPARRCNMVDFAVVPQRTALIRHAMQVINS